MSKEYVRYVALALAGFAVGVFITMMIERFTPASPAGILDPITATSTGPDLNNAPNVFRPHQGASQLQVGAQNAGPQVLVDAVVIPEDGWLVVHEVQDGHVGNALGAARKDAGSHEAVTIDLLRITQAGGSYMVILYADDGDKLFELNADIPIVDTDGNPVMQQFMAQ